MMNTAYLTEQQIFVSLNRKKSACVQVWLNQNRAIKIISDRVEIMAQLSKISGGNIYLEKVSHSPHNANDAESV